MRPHVTIRRDPWPPFGWYWFCTDGTPIRGSLAPGEFATHPTMTAAIDAACDYLRQVAQGGGTP